MIQLCTCTGGSTSTISKRRGTISCKNCGGKSVIDGKRSSSSCLLSTVLELTSLINSDVTWTKVSKGCRSSSRRPRRSNIINTTSGELPTTYSEGLEMPVSESEKLGVSVLGCHFSERAEHIPIKKRRFLFKASSPPRNVPNSDVTERNAMSIKDSNHGLLLNPNATCSSSACETINDDKLIKDEDFSGISILAAAACSNSLGVEADRCEASGIISSGMKSFEAPVDIEYKENNVKPANICIEKFDCHTKKDSSPGKFTLDNSSTPDESTLDNSNSLSQAPLESAVSKTNQEASMIQTSSARDVRLNWDLNTVMDAWEEPVGTDHEISTSVEERKNDYMKGSSEDCKLGLKRSISNPTLPVEMKSLAHKSKELKLGKHEPDSYAEVNDSASHAVIDETESLQYKQIDGTKNALPVATTHSIFTKWPTEAVDTELSMDCSIPPGFDHCLRTSKENVDVSSTVGVGNDLNNPRHNLSLTTVAFLENGAQQSVVTSVKDEDEDKSRVKMEDLVSKVSKGTDLDIHESVDPSFALSSMHDAEAPMDNGFGCNHSQSDNKAGSGIDKLDETSIGYDSQYEDGELRESSMQVENEANLDQGINNVIHEASSQIEQEGSSRITPAERDVISSVLLPEELHNSDEVNETIITDQEDGKRQDVVKEAGQADEWKMNVSGWDLLPENHRSSSNNFTKTRNFSSRKFSYREQKDGFEPDGVETKGEGSRFYRKESLTRIGGPSTRDTFVSNRGRFRMQGCSSKGSDDLPSRPDSLRSFGRGRYSPPSRASGRGGTTWNRSPERGRDLKRLPSPSYQAPPFFRSMLDDVGPMDNTPNETNMDPTDINRPNNSSYITRRAFRSRSPLNREENDFRARLGLRPTETCHDRFTGRGGARGRGRTVRYGGPGPGPRSRYHGPANDECDELFPEYSNFPRRRRCFSPIERRTNQSHSYVHHRSNSRSPSNPVFRRRNSRSPPSFRPDARIRRPRSPAYRRSFEDHVNEYNNPGPRNNTSPPPRWVNYKERERERERFDFYGSSRKPKQNEYYRSGHSGRFPDRPRYNDGDRPTHGYRRGGFVRKRFHYEEENDGFDLGYDARDKQALEFHARTSTNTNTKPYGNGTTTDSRFRDFPRRVREDRDGVTDGGFRRRKDVNEESEQHVTDDTSSQRRSTTNIDSTTPSETVKEGDEDKPMLGSN